jgi:hypothetical protein
MVAYWQIDGGSEARMKCFLYASGSIIIGLLAGEGVVDIAMRLHMIEEWVCLVLGLLGGMMTGLALCLEG